MLDQKAILQTQDMIDKRHLDIRTITMGISLLDCAHEDVNECARRIYDKITRRAEKLVKTGEDIEKEYGLSSLNDFSQLVGKKYDVIVLAVSHKEFFTLDIRKLRKDESIVFDIKSVLPREEVDARL